MRRFLILCAKYVPNRSAQRRTLSWLDIDAALVKKVFNIPKRERKSDIHEYGELDDFSRCFEVAEGTFGQFPKLSCRIGHLKVFALTTPMEGHAIHAGSASITLTNP